MKLLPKVGEYFALDIGTTAIRVVQLTGQPGAWSLLHYGVAPIDIRISSSDAPEDQLKLGEVIMTAIGQSGIAAKDVIIGIPSNKTFATVVDIPDMPAEELASTIKYQADQYIPMSTDEAKIDWAVLGKSAKDPAKNEVLVASVSNKFSEARLDMIESLGLNVVAMEPDSLALVRSLAAPTNEAQLIVEVGDFATDIVLSYGGAPRLIRSVPTGVQTFIKAATQNLNVQPQQAQQFIMKFGLQKDKLEGQVYKAMENSLEQFSSEIIKSVKFFQTRYPNIAISSLVASNYAVTVPAFSNYLAEKVGIRVTYGNPWQQVKVSPSDQSTLQPLSAQFAVAIGLAQRGVQ